MTDHDEAPSGHDQTHEVSDDYRALLKSVRSAAGWRVSPRHLDVALQALIEVGEEFDVERITGIVNALHGDRSQRQRRNPDLWRLLGAQLAVRGKYGGPDAQQRFIGRAKALAGDGINDTDLLLVATALGSANHALTSEITADATTWLVEQFGDEFSETVISDHLDPAVEAAMAARAEYAARRRRGRG
jgi:hypothetical protein